MSLSDPAPPLSLSTNMAFSTSLLKHGTDSLASDVIGKLANTSNAAGQAVVASLSEGKNRALMAECGISPIKFG
jgi:cell division GTPase FtsZ